MKIQFYHECFDYMETLIPHNYFECNTHQKIQLKSHYLRVNGKRAHFNKPDFLKILSHTQIISLLSREV